MSKVVKGVKKVVKKVVRGIKKAWKAITSSTIGKVILIAAAIYFGGIAMGAWNAPGGAAVTTEAAAAGMTELSAADAVLASEIAATDAAIASGGVGAGEAAFAAQGAGTAVAEGAVVNMAPAAGGANTVAASVVPTGAVPAAGTSAADAALASEIATPITPYQSAADTMIAQGGGQAGTLNIGNVAGANIPPVSLPPGTESSWLSGALKTSGQYVKDNPLLAAMGLNAVATMMQPDPEDALKEQEKQRLADIERRRQNLADTANVNVGMRPGEKVLRDNSGNPIFLPKPGGIINNQVS